MLVTLPLLFFLLIYILFYTSLTNSTACYRIAFLSSAIVWGTLLTIFTEGLNIFHSISFLSVATTWFLACIIAGCICVIQTRRNRLHPHLNLKALCCQPFDLVSLFSVFVIIAATVVIALQMPPRINDSLVYHMSRVSHWIQNESIDFYLKINGCD